MAVFDVQYMHFQTVMVGCLVLLCGVGAVLGLTRAITIYQFHRSKSQRKEPPTVPYWLPWFGNLFQFMFDQGRFWEDIAILSRSNPLLRARMGPLQAYIITGSSNFQAVFRKSKSLSFEYFLRRVMEIPFGYSRPEIDLFFSKKEGRLPVLDTFHQIHHEHLTDSKAVNALTKRFVEVMASILIDEQGKGDREILLYEFLRTKMAQASITALCGTKFLELNPTFIEDFWEFDQVFMKLTLGTPRLMFRHGYEVRDKVLGAVQRWLAEAWKQFDWEGPGADAEWEEYFGATMMRTREKAFVETVGSSLESRASSEFGIIFALNSNAVPATSWALLRILQRPELLDNIRREVSQVTTKDEKSSQIHLDIPNMILQPWLLAVYTEVLRLYVSMNVTREIIQDMEIDGQVLKAGHIVMAPSYVAHTLDASSFDVEGKFPAKEFWPERFLSFGEKSEKSEAKFSAGSKSGKMFPYGAGTAICPGRFFAKQEIMAGVALVIASFDFEVLGYTKRDGTNCGRAPGMTESCHGMGLVPPNGDIRVRMKRR